MILQTIIKVFNKNPLNVLNAKYRNSVWYHPHSFYQLTLICETAAVVWQNHIPKGHQSSSMFLLITQLKSSHICVHPRRFISFIFSMQDRSGLMCVACQVRWKGENGIVLLGWISSDNDTTRKDVSSIPETHRKTKGN